MKIYFVRHGQTNYNVLGLCNDDPSKKVYLTELGKQQAWSVKPKIGDVKFDLVIVSELPRTRETALLICESCEDRFIVDPRINDRKTGFDSKPVHAFFEALAPDIFHLKFNDGESFIEEKKRVFSFLQDLESLKSKYQNILVVTHSEILKIIYGYYHNLSYQDIWELEIDNGYVFEVDIK